MRIMWGVLLLILMFLEQSCTVGRCISKDCFGLGSGSCVFDNGLRRHAGFVPLHVLQVPFHNRYIVSKRAGCSGESVHNFTGMLVLSSSCLTVGLESCEIEKDW